MGLWSLLVITPKPVDFDILVRACKNTVYWLQDCYNRLKEMPELGHFLEGNIVGISLAKKYSPAVTAVAVDLAVGHTMMLKYW